MDDFKEIPNTNALYFINKNGILKRGGKILTPVLKNGYNSYSLSVSNKVKVVYAHRLVAHAFIPNPENKPQVNHKNGIKTDNRIENLEWATYSENIRHSFSELGRVHIGLKGNLNGMYKVRAELHPKSKPVKCSNGIIYGSRKEAARQLGVNAGNITLICNGKRKSIKGYTFEWIK